MYGTDSPNADGFESLAKVEHHRLTSVGLRFLIIIEIPDYIFCGHQHRNGLIAAYQYALCIENIMLIP